jgi:hypothetical protein
MLGDIGKPKPIGPLSSEFTFDKIIMHRRSTGSALSLTRSDRRADLGFATQPPNTPFGDPVATITHVIR